MHSALDDVDLKHIAATIPGTLFQFSSRSGIWSVDYFSDRIYDLIGLTADAIDLETFITLQHPDDRVRYLASVTEAVDHFASWHYEGRLIRPDGETRWWQGSSVPTPQENGDVLFCGLILDITHSKQTEYALQDSQHKLSLMVQHTPIAILEWSSDFKILGCNPAAERLFGYSQAELQHCCLQDLLKFNDEFSQEQVELLQQPGGIHTIYKSWRKDGQPLVCEWCNLPLTDTHGRVISFVSMIFDITQHQQAEAALRRSNQQIINILSSISDAFFSLDNQWCFTYLNPQTEPLLQRSVDELLGKNIWEMFPAAIGSAFYHQYHRAMTEQVPVVFEELYTPFEKWYEVRVYPFDAGLSIYFRDISDRKAAEAKLKHTNQELESRVQVRTTELLQTVEQLQHEVQDRQLAETQLQEQAQFLQSIWDGVDYGIFVLDVLEEGAEFRYAAFNSAMDRYSPISMRQLLGRKLSEALPPEMVPRFQHCYQTCVQLRKTLTFEESFEHQGVKTWWLLAVTPLMNSEHQVHRLVVTATDISDRKQTEEAMQQSEATLRQKATELEQALNQLQRTQVQLIQSEKMSSLGQLVAGVAHEINNPVNFIYGNLSYANDYAQDLLDLLQLYQTYAPSPAPEIEDAVKAIDLEFLAEDFPKILSSMRVGADRIQQIVASLRNFSRMDEAAMKAVNLHEGIDSTLMILQNRLKAKADRPAIQIVKHYGDLPPIECYPGELNQVFMNILSNAIDALEHEHEYGRSPIGEAWAGQICIVTEQVGDRVVIRISDNGPGMPPAICQRLFDPFFTTKPVGQGTGMGLSISYQVVTERHQGTLRCISAPGQGAEFIINIPAWQAEE